MSDKKPEDLHDEYQNIVSEGLTEDAADREKSEERKTEAAKSHRNYPLSFLLILLGIMTLGSAALYFLPGGNKQPIAPDSPPPDLIASELQTQFQQQRESLGEDQPPSMTVNHMIRSFEPQMRGALEPVTPQLIKAIKKDLRAQGLSEEEINSAMQVDEASGSIIVNK